MNDYSRIDGDSENRDLARIDCREIEPELTPEEITEQQLAREDEQPYDGGGWPGDGSGTDDLADYNQNEADDYRDE